MSALTSKVCERCRGEFFKPPRTGLAKWAGQRFCSHRCAQVRRLDELIDRTGPFGCWLWLGAMHRSGYGYITVYGKMVQAHRYVYEDLAADIPAGLQLDHLCRNPACVNPAHLEPVTPRENILRGIAPPARNAVATACLHGHPFDDVNTYRHPNGGRVCRECVRASGRRYRRREKNAQSA